MKVWISTSRTVTNHSGKKKKKDFDKLHLLQIQPFTREKEAKSGPKLRGGKYREGLSRTNDRAGNQGTAG